MQRLFSILLLLLFTSPVLAGVVIIANPDNSELVLGHSEVERIYLGKMTHWSDDSGIVPVMLKNGATHEAFLDEYMNRTVHRFVSYWRQMVFTGKGIPPKTFTDDAELAAYVARTPGAVGYVSEKTSLSGVKVLKIR